MTAPQPSGGAFPSKNKNGDRKSLKQEPAPTVLALLSDADPHRVPRKIQVLPYGQRRSSRIARTSFSDRLQVSRTNLGEVHNLRTQHCSNLRPNARTSLEHLNEDRAAFDYARITPHRRRASAPQLWRAASNSQASFYAGSRPRRSRRTPTK